MKHRELETRLDEIQERIANLATCDDNPVYAAELETLRKERTEIMVTLTKLNERLKMVKVMDFAARQINDEEVFESWLMFGVADGDIDYNGDDLSVLDEEWDSLACYYEDEKAFAELMDTFLRLMERARHSGGLYCGGVLDEGNGPEHMPFYRVSWSDEDLSSALASSGFPATDENLRALRGELINGRHRLHDNTTMAGWNTIHDAVDFLDLEGALKKT